MNLQIKDKLKLNYSFKRFLYTLCFCLFCVIDQRTKTGTGLDGWIETFRDLTGVGMAILILSNLQKEELKKWKLPYIVWTVLAVLGGIGALILGGGKAFRFNNWIVIVLDVVLYGYVLIRTFIKVVLEKQYPQLNKKFLAVWLGMMAWMLISRSTYIWPLCYLVMFGCFYLTDYSKEDQEQLFQGMLDGIILGFFCIQGLCFVFRPYDVPRYQGMYHNPNLNVLFYVEVLAAVFAKLLTVYKKSCSKAIRVYYLLGAGVVLSFVLLSIGRTGWVTAIILMFLFLWMMNKILNQKKAIVNFLVLCLCVVITFPLCFGAARYLPPVFHHPIWFWGEWSTERVHSWDPWDSEKYIDIDEYFDSALGRIFDSFSNLFEHSPLALRSLAAEIEEANEAVGEELPPNKIPVLLPEQDTDTILVRSTIYKYYAGHLNILGHPYEEQGFQLHKYYWVGHAHNIFLQYGTDFGIPVMIVFAVLIVWGCIILLKKFLRNKDVEAAANMMYLLIPAVFGMLECSWGVGSLSILMMFVAWRKVICDGE